MPNRPSFRIEDYPLGKASVEEERQVTSFLLQEFETWRQYWAPRVENGERVENAVAGKFFSSKALADMDSQGMVPIEIPELWPSFQAMLGMAYLGRKSVSAIPRTAGEALGVEGLNIMMQSVIEKIGLRQSEESAYNDGISTGFPQFVFFDKSWDPLSERHAEAEHAPWKFVLPDPYWTRDDLQDCRGIFRIRLVTEDDCLERYPDRAEQIRKAFSGRSNPSALDSTNMSADQRSAVFSAVQMANADVLSTGRTHLLEYRTLVRRKAKVWASPKSDKVEILPKEWDDARKAAWVQAHPDYKEVEVPVKILWIATCLKSGELLENAPHWMQRGEYDCEVYVPQWHDHTPVGALEFAVDNAYMAALAKTTHLHSLRWATDQLKLFREGAFKNEEDVYTESSQPGGKLIVKKGVPMGEAFYQVPNQGAQQGWRDVYAEAQATNGRLTVDRNVEGGTQSSQESFKVCQGRVQQNQTKAAPYLSSWQRFTLRTFRKLFLVLQETVPEGTAFRWMKEEGGQQQAQEVVVNQPQTDAYGDLLGLLNDLSASEFDFVEGQTDDSVTGQQHELVEFSAVMESILPKVPPDQWPVVLGQIPNGLTKRIAAELNKRIEASSNAPTKLDGKVNVTVDASKLAMDPIAQQVIRLTAPDFKFENPQAAPAAPAGGQMAPIQGASQPEGAAPPSEPQGA